MQKGHLFKLHGAWHLQFRRDEIVGGQTVRKRVCKRLAPVNDDFRSRKDLQELIDRHLVKVNAGELPEGSLTFTQFFESHFLPHIEAKRKPSTHRFYRDTFRYYLKEKIGSVKLRDFTTGTAQEVLDSIDLSHQSLLRIKTVMSAAFKIARQKDFYRDANPATDTRAEGRETDFEGHAYSLKEISTMLGKLGEPARTAVAVAAFAGLREGEIRGLSWPDYNGGLIKVQQAVWRTYVGKAKTKRSHSTVPVIKPLRIILDEHKRKLGENPDGFIFQGPKKGFALNLDNLTRREIRPVLGDSWHGWHGFRRGLATNLFELGVPVEIAQVILRHADAATTRKHYLKLQSQKHGKQAMKTLERAVGRRKFGQQMANSYISKLPRGISR